jgi:hypothetical protein
MITALSRLATVPEQGIQKVVPQPSVAAPSPSTNPPAATLAQAAPAPAASLLAFARSIPSGRSATLAWSSTNAQTCSGAGFSASGASGSVIVSPTSTTTYGITCTGSGGAASQSVTVAVTPAPKLAVGMTVQTTGSVAMHNSPSMSAPIVVVVAPGTKGAIIGGPASSDGSTWWEVPSKSGTAAWAVQDDLMQASQAAPTVTLSASPTSIPGGQSSTLTWTSANASACRGTGKGFSPSGPSGSQGVSLNITTTFGITCTGAGGSASQSVTVAVTAASALAIGMTVAATGLIYIYPTPLPNASAIGSEAPGNQGAVINGPTSSTYTWWQVAFSDDLTGWTSQASLAAASPTAPTLTFSANPPAVALGASSTLSWSSTNATSCTGVGFSPLGASGSVAVSPTASANYSIACTGAGGLTTRSASVVVNPLPTISWKQSLPVTFNAPGTVPFGGTETRALVFMDGSLYAGIGDWEDPQLENPQTPGAQVLRLDSPTSSWVEDQDFNQPRPSQPTEKHYEAISILGTAHFDHDGGGSPITPVDVLMAGVWSFSTGLEIYEKTVTTGSVGAKGTWTDVFLEPRPNHNGQVRSFGSYTDSMTHVEMAFAGSDPYGIFSGAFDSTSKSILWGATAEAGSASLTSSASSEANSHRVMSFASCGGKLYASAYDAIAVRTDGANPSWRPIYQYSGPAIPPQSSGFRGLTCVPNLNGSGFMLIAALESNSIDIYDIPLNGSQPTIELYTSNFLSTQLEAWVGYGIAAYNNMIVYPESGTASCPDLLIGLSLVADGYASAYETYYPTPSFLVRYCNGAYDFHTIIDPSITPGPPLLATRALAVSQFNGDPAGTIYSGGYDAHNEPAHNTDWIYRGVPK